jgi:hypothetical protein
MINNYNHQGYAAQKLIMINKKLKKIIGRVTATILKTSYNVNQKKDCC